MWGRAGELVPRNMGRLRVLLDGLGLPINWRVRGNLAFITTR
jgi:hypothetical protein